MKRQISFIGLFLSGILLLTACSNHTDINKSTTTFYIIQPAEHYHAFDGHLTWYGRLRATALADFFKDSTLHRIYRSGFSRAIGTIDSLKKLKKIDVVQYAMDSVVDNIARLLKQHEDYGRKILLVCPPDQMNAVIKRLGVDATSLLNHKNQFNVIYMIVNNKGKARMTRKTFGKAPMPPKQDTAKTPSALKN